VTNSPEANVAPNAGDVANCYEENFLWDLNIAGARPFEELLIPHLEKYPNGMRISIAFCCPSTTDLCLKGF
jgi:hypothetical protein